LINNRQNGRRRGRGGVRPPNGANNLERGSRLDNRARGNASQLHEKYKTLARDAQMQGDRVMTEYYLQFADHYFRVLSESRARLDEQQQQQQQRRERYDGPDSDEDDGDGEGDEQPRVASVEHNRAAPPRHGDRAPEGDRDMRRERQPRPEREPREARRDEEQAEAHTARAPRDEAPAEDAEARRPRGRRPRVRKDEADAAAPDERIEIDRLPPALATEPEAKANGTEPAADEPEAKPVRRTRRTTRPAADPVNVDA
jgi:hypothetical protein